MSFWRICKIASSSLRWLPSPLFRLLWRMLDVFDGRMGAMLRYILIASRFNACGRNVYLGPFITIDSPPNVSVGNNVSIHQNVTILSAGGVVIGNDVAIAHGSSIVSGDHTWDSLSLPIKYNQVRLSRVEIEDDVWIGCGVRILSGVNIGRRTVIAAGAVVVTDCQGGAVYGGVPAKRIKKINE
ncbi:acyltransferase [Rhodanobacter ginsengiterrae]|uniref:acyltransferase n=1 Tax=Rhodanobacter ginsengiterrae TaxID=2008451 RepID=UPI003CFA9057